MNFYDVVVVGAGPAGANFARLIDAEKYRVAVIDGSDGHDKVCGGLLSPDAQDVLARYDLSLPCDVLASPQLFSVRTIDLRDGYTRHYRRCYLNVDRKKFDDFLRSMIPRDVDVLNTRCRSLCKTDDGYEIELLNGERIICGTVVGADGASSVVRSSLFKNKRIERYVAIQQWFNAEKINPYYSCIFDNDTSEGCSWIFFKDGKMIFGGAFGMKGGREAFEEQKRKLVSLGFVDKSTFAEPIRTEACLVSRPHLSGGIFRGDDTAYLLGEAAGFISPSSFEGISYALSSSEALAEAFNSKEKSAHSSRRKKYVRDTVKLSVKVKIRCIKRPFMYGRNLRRLVMKSGITAIDLKTTK